MNDNCNKTNQISRILMSQKAKFKLPVNVYLLIAHYVLALFKKMYDFYDCSDTRL